MRRSDMIAEGSRIARGLVPVLAWLVCAMAAYGQTPDRAFVESVDVEVIEVDVVVTDRKGRPVRGLSRDDFELYADGERVEISNFAEFESTLGAKPDEDSPSGSSGASSTGAGTNLTVVLYLDDANLHGPHRTRALRRLAEAVAPWRAWGARYMLATFRDRLEIVTPPTPDLDHVLEAASRRRRGTTRGLAQHVARRRAILEIVETDPACDGPYMAIARRHAAEEANRVAAAVAGLADLVSVLGGVPGKKAVLYVSDSLPRQPGEAVWSYLAHQHCANDRRATSRLMSELAGSDESRRFDLLTRHANANRVTFYAVDAAGVRAGLAADASLPLGMSSSLFENDSVHRLSSQSGMHAIAAETGGKLLANSNDLVELLLEASEQLEAAYSLGFMPAKRRPGKVRKLRVELAPHAAAGRRVQHRESYRDKPLSERLADRLLATTYLGDLDNPLSIKVGFDPPNKTGRKRFKLGVNVVVPEESVLLLPGPGRKRAELRLWLLALDRKNGVRTAAREKVVTLGRRGVTAKAGVYWFNISMKLARSEYDVAVGVRDEISGEMSLLRLPVDVAPSPKKARQKRSRDRSAATAGS